MEWGAKPQQQTAAVRWSIVAINHCRNFCEKVKQCAETESEYLFHQKPSVLLKYRAEHKSGRFFYLQKNNSKRGEDFQHTVTFFDAHFKKEGKEKEMKKQTMILLCVLLCLFTMSSGIFADTAEPEFKYYSNAYSSATQYETTQASDTIIVQVPDTATAFAIEATLPENSTAKATYTNANNKKSSVNLTNGKKVNLSSFIKAGGTNNTATITVTAGEAEKVYTIKTTRILSLSALSTEDYVISPTFKGETKEYSVVIPDTIKTLSISATAKSTSATISYNGEKNNTVNIEKTDKIEISLTEEGNIAETYTLNLKKQAYKDITITASAPENAIITVKDKATGKQIAQGYGSVTAKAYNDITYTVSQNGYAARSGDIIYAELPKDAVSVELTKAEENNRIDSSITAEWKNYRNSDVNMAITDAKLPYTANETLEFWSDNYSGTYAANHPIPQLIVDNALIVCQSNRILKVNKTTGEIIAEGTMVTNGGFTTLPTAVYAEGMIFCALSNGTVQAFDAKTMESLWVYSDPLKGQSLTTMTYSDGYIYTGFWNNHTGKANYVCLSVTDEDPTKSDEAKTATWTKAHDEGYYWAGALILDDIIIFGGDNGYDDNSDENSQKPGAIFALNKYTGETLCEESVIGDLRSAIAYDKSDNRIYFTTKCGYLYSAAIDSKTGTISDLKYQDGFGSQSTSTPIVYDGTVYFTAGSGITATGSKGNFIACDATTLKAKFIVPLLGYPQGGFILSTAYLESEGKLCFYTTYNNNPGGLTLIKVDPNAADEKGVETEEIFTPENAQYSVSSLLCDANGTIYYKNDTPLVFAVGRSEAYLEDLTSDIGTWDNAFATSRVNYEIVVPVGTKEVTFSAKAPEGMSVTLNGEKTDTVSLTEGKATAAITVTSNAVSRTYTVFIREASTATTLRMLINGSNSITTGNPTEATTDGNIITVWNPTKYTNIWLAPQNNSTVTNFEIIKGAEETPNFTAKTSSNTYNDISYIGYYRNSTFTLPLVAQATVTAEDGRTTETCYFVAAEDENSVGYISSLSFDQSTYFFEKDCDTMQLDLTCGKQIGTGETEKLTWTSSNPSVATVDEDGTVTKVGDGQTIITAMGTLTSASCTVATDKINVTFRLIGATESSEPINFSENPGEYYGSEYQTWIKTTSYTMPVNSTVYDVFMKAIEENSLEQTGADKGYVSSITAPDVLGGYEMAEFTNGNYSGWQYTVNGIHPRLSVLQCNLKDNDVVVFHYTNDFTYEDESTANYPEYQNKWLEAKDGAPADVIAAEAVEDAINAIGTVNSGSKQAIDKARNAYNALTEEQKALVENEDILLAAEKAFADITTEVPFTDIPDAWYREAIHYAYVNDLMIGMSETTFEPQTALSRAMFITMIYRLEGEPEISGTIPYNDVPAEEWFTNAILWGTEQGIVEGYDNSFAPNADITREEMVAMLYRYAKTKGIDVSVTSDLTTFTDGMAVSNWCKDEMGWAVSAKLINGYENNTLQPQGKATRAEAATIIMRYAETFTK